MRIISAIGRWSARHPWQAIALWLTFVVAAVAASALTGTKSLQNGTVGESARATSLLNRYRPGHVERQDYGFVHSDALAASTPAFRAATADVRGRMESVLGTPVTTTVSRDGHSVLLTAMATQEFGGPLQDSLAGAAAAHPGFTIGGDGPGHGGDASSDLTRAERLALPVTLLVLLIAFGALVAALVPMLLGLTAVIATFGLLGPISQLAPLDDAVKTIVLLIGMAVGVDYALFYVIRSREERQRGVPAHEALERTARTSGRTVVIAGATVAIAMAGQFVVGSAIFTGIAAGTIAVVAFAVAGSVTVLPAVLELLGPRIDAGRIPYLPHLSTEQDSRFWPAVVDRVLRRPVVSVVVAGGLLVALAVPALGMKIAEPDSDALKPSSRSEAATMLHAVFPGTSQPALLVVVNPPGRTARVRTALARLERLAAAEGLAHPPFHAGRSPDGRATLVELPLTGLGDNTASRNAVEALRGRLIPETLGGIPGVQTAVGGATAQDVDFTNQVRHGMPYVIAFVLTLAFLVLLVAFRSIVVPLKAIALNLLSVAAAYGVIVLVFQHHWAEGLLGFHSNGSIIAWLPLFLFVILFGLSMDYHVFILSRIREAVDDGLPTEQAVRYGIARTAGVVTSAAFVMVGVFSIFGTLSQLDVKEAGVGLATAVLIDATIVRGVLLPASMTLLGDWNWYLPRWLQWLPQTNLHGRPRERVAAPALPADSPGG